MKKKVSKLTALMLTLAMALSLALPAWAVEGADPPLLISPAPVESGTYLSWDEFLQQYVEDHPELYESFDADAFFAEEYPWETKEDFMRYMNLEDEAAFKEYLWQESLYYLDDNPEDSLYQTISDAYDAYLIETYESRHPGELDRLKTEDLLAALGYTKTLTPMEQFMEEHSMSDQSEVRSFLVSDYAWSRLNVEDTHVKALAYQELYPEQWANFDADAWFVEEYSYWDSKEEYTNYYYLTTEDEFREDMFVDYVGSESWMWDTGWWNGSGSKAVSLMANGEDVDAAIAVENGVSYTDGDTLNAILGTNLTGGRIAIRQAAQDAGWDVVWNAYSNQILLFHRDSLPQGDFTRLDALMNRLLSAARLEEGQSYKTTETMDLKLTAFNSLDGDKTCTARITAEMLQKDNRYELTVTVNAADLLRLLPAQSLEQFQAQLGIQDLGRLLRSCKFTAILNGETGMLYFNAPFLNLVDSSISADTWYSFETDAMPFDQSNPEWDTNDFLYQTMLSESANSFWAEYAYYSYLQTQETLGSLFGPQQFTERGGTLTWSLNTRSLQDLLAQEDAEAAAQIASLFKEFEVKLSVSQNGSMTSDAVLRLDMDALAQWSQDTYDAPDPFYTALTAWALNLLDFRLESHASGTASSSTSTASLHWKNQFKLEMTGRSTRQKTTAEPRALPPAGSKIEFPFGPLGSGSM